MGFWVALRKRLWPYWAPAIGLGHALRGVDKTEASALHEALDLVNGALELTPRAPLRPGVLEAERRLAPGADRPLYAFVGALHFDLGTVGLILSRRWAQRATVGVTRCDTGGLEGGHGGFACVPGHERDMAMKSITVACRPFRRWWRAFCDEVRSSYDRSFEGYVAGEEPNAKRWVDIRQDCINHADDISKMDRRLWTWEVRLGKAPRRDDYQYLVVSPQNGEYLQDLFFKNVDVPARVRILGLTFLPDGLHWFETEPVQHAFLGALERI